MGEGREGSTAHAHGIQAAELVPQEQRPQHPTARAPQGQSTASSQGAAAVSLHSSSSQGAAAVEGHSTSSVSAGQNGLWLAVEDGTREHKGSMQERTKLLPQQYLTCFCDFSF